MLMGCCLIVYNIHNKYLWSRNAKADLGLRSDHFKLIFSTRWEDVTTGKLNTKEHLTGVFKHELFRDAPLTADQFINYWLSNDQFINEPMIELARSLTVPIYIGTNQDEYRTAHIARLIGSHFQTVFSSYQIGHLKPNSRSEHVERTLTLQPHELLLIDDTLANVTGAQKRGWQGYFYQGDFNALRKQLLGLAEL